MVTPSTVTDFCPQVFEDAAFEGHSKPCRRTDFKVFLHLSGLSQSPGTNTALGKGSQSLNKSRSKLEEEWAEHHRREQREMEIINRQNIH